MTELQCLLTFIMLLPGYPGQSDDVFRLSRLLRTCHDHNDDEALVSLAERLIQLDDQIISVFNGIEHKFKPVHGFRTRPQSVLPRFLYGLISRVFLDDGTLKDDYCDYSFEALITGLRLVRRCSIKSQASIAEQRGVAEFLDAQRAPDRTFDVRVADSLAVMWHALLSDDPDVILGFPGNGVTLDMRFPYAPSMSFVSPRSVPRPIYRYMHTALDKFLPSYDLYSDCELIKFYEYIPYPDRTCTLVCVPKSFKVQRGISITNTAAVIVGATLRETIWQQARHHGLKDAMNVHEQSRSHRILRKFFKRIACLDLRGGSTCFTVKQQLHYLSKSHFATNMFNFSRPFMVQYKSDEPVEVTTLTMGDSSCTALLTTNLAFFVLLSIARKYLGLLKGEVFPAAMFRTVIQFAIESGIFDMFAVVGDDVIIPEEIYDEFIEICQSQGVTINERKSSRAESNHKETCGAWVIATSTGDQRSIYPFRAVNQNRNLSVALASSNAHFRRTRTSRFAVELMIANAPATHMLEYLNTEAYTPDEIGCPLGKNPRPRKVVPGSKRSVKVPDDIAFAFKCKDSEIAVRESRRPDVPRGRIRKFVDSPKRDRIDASVAADRIDSRPYGLRKLMAPSFHDMFTEQDNRCELSYLTNGLKLSGSGWVS